MEWKGERLPLERRGSESFLVPHDDFALFLLGSRREDERVVAATYGPYEYARAGCAATPSSHVAPAAWSAYVGHYRSFSPWLSNFRVIQRGESLHLVGPTGDETSLTPLTDHRFKLGEGREIRFGALVDGLALEATLLTSKYYRVHQP